MKSLSAAGGEQIRLDKFLSDHLSDLSRTQIQKMIQDGLVLVNQTKAKPSLKLEGTESITYTIPEVETVDTHIEPEPIPLDILYEDEVMVAINKQAGLTVHPGVGKPNGTLVNGLAHHFKSLSDVNGALRPGIVHRLDENTSGVILVAKTNKAHSSLASQFEKRTIQKEYFGITWGVWEDSEGTIDGAIKRKRSDPTSYEIEPSGRSAQTGYKVLNQGPYISAVSFFPKTGRTHQIRVHSASMDHPIIGDDKYGGGLNRSKGFIPEVTKSLRLIIKGLGRHALHAKQISFSHPTTKSTITIEAPVPEDISSIGVNDFHG